MRSTRSDFCPGRAAVLLDGVSHEERILMTRYTNKLLILAVAGIIFSATAVLVHGAEPDSDEAHARQHKVTIAGPLPLPVKGTVTVSGAVSVNNLPANQAVTVSNANLPVAVTNANLPVTVTNANV